MSKLERLFLDQQLFGFFCKTLGLYNFTTSKIGLAQYEVNFVNKDDVSNALVKVNLLKNKELVMSFDVSETLNYKTLSFELAPESKFNFLYLCITFKFFYQYVKQNTNYEKLVLRTTRYQSYIFKRLFGFAMIGWDKDHFYLEFKTKESLQNIWDEYYGTSLDENLYNFVLPVDAGGYVPGNIKLKKPNTAATGITDFKKTEKRFYHSEMPRGEIKIGYDLHTISIRDLSETGISFIAQATEDGQAPPEMQMQHIYSVWITDNQLNMNWTNLSVQIVWQKDNVYGCRIRENSPAWKQFIRMMDIKHYQRLTFIQKNDREIDS